MEKKYPSRDTIVGKQVIDSSAIIVGNVKEVTFNPPRKTIALNVTGKEGNDITIEGNTIAAFGDVVLLKPKEQPSTTKPKPSPTTPDLYNIYEYQIYL